MLLLDITVVNVALPDIQRSLHSSFRDLQWVVNAYSLTLAAFLLTAGALADLFGRRRVFVTGLAVFTASSAACGLAGSPLALNLARAVQGLGGAMMFATSLALIADAFHGKERGVAFGVFGGVIGAAVAIGPVVGGVITSGIGWEWIFFVNVPIGAGAVALTLNQVAESRDPNASGVDWLGLLTFSGSLFLLVFALIQGNEKGWGSARILSYLIGSAALLALFVVAGRLSVRVPVRLLLGTGLLLVSGGLLAMTAITASSGWTTLIPGFVIAGAGIGMINPPLASTAIGVVHHTRSGMASGINNTFRQVGIATGIAGLGAVFQHEVTHRTTAV